MSLRKYMVIDLTILGLVGAVLEGVGVRSGFYVLAGNTPTTIISLLILFLSIVRWKWYGLAIVPILALGNFIGCLSIDPGKIEDYLVMFDYKYFISVLLGLSTMFVPIILMQKFGTNSIVKSNYKLVGISFLIFVLYELARVLSYWILGGRYIDILNAGFFDLVSLVVLILGSIIIRTQGSMIDVKDKIIADHEERLALNKEHLIQFDIDDADIEILKNKEPSKE
jgi:hypothetical protein